MNDVDNDLREMFRRHETDVGGPMPPSGLRRRVRRRQAGTILKGALVAAVVVLGSLGIRASVTDWNRPGRTPAPPPSPMILRGFGVGFSADGARLLTRSMTSAKGSIYNPRTGALIQVVKGPRNIGGQENTGLLQSFAPDGQRFVTALGDPATTWVNDASTGTAVRRFPGACCLATFSPDGRLLAAPCCMVGTRVYDLGTGTVVDTFDSSGVMTFSPDSDRLVISVGPHAPSHVVAHVWDVGADQAQPALTLRGLGGANVAQASVAWSPDSSMIAIVGGPTRARKVMVFDGQTGEKLFTIEPASGAVSVAFSPDSSMIAIGEDHGRASLWMATADPTRVLGFRPHETEVASIAFSPDGTQLMTGAWHEDATMLWDVASLRSSA